MNNVFKWLTDNKKLLMDKYILRMIPNTRDAEDFFHDLYIIMSNKDEKKLKKIYDNNELEPYVFIIIRNNLKSASSRYYFTYRKPNGLEYEENKDDREYKEDNNKEVLLNEIESEWKTLKDKIDSNIDSFIEETPRAFVDKELFNLFFKQDLSHRAITEKLDIPTTSVFNNIKKTKDRILLELDKDIKELDYKLEYYNNL